MPVTDFVSKLIERGPEKKPPPPPPLKPPGPGVAVVVCFGTVPEMWTALRVSEPAAIETCASFEIEATSVEGKVCCVPEVKRSLLNFAPGFRLWKSKPRGSPSERSFARSAGVSDWKPPEVVAMTSGRVTDMSVPRPVRGFSTFACAWLSPVERALTVTTSPTPTARPSAVSRVRPRRRRSSASMYEM